MKKHILRPCEKFSVNSSTVIKNDIASGLKNSRSIFLQYTITTVICQAFPAFSLPEWKQTECRGSAQPVVYTAPTVTAARTFCPPLPLTAHGHCPAKYDILDIARQ